MDSLATVSILILASFLWLGCDAPGSAGQSSDRPEPMTSVPPPLSSEPAEPPVLAIVNDRTITKHEVERRLDRLSELYHHSRRPFDERTRHQKKHELVQRLIDQELLREHLSAGHFEPEPARIDAEFTRRVQERFGTVEALERYLDSEELTMADYRHQLREELFIQQLVMPNDEAAAVDEEELREHYERIAHKRPAGERLQATILSIRRPVGVDEATAQRIKESLRRSLDQVQDDRDFRALVERIGQGPSAAKLQRLRWVERHQLSPAAAQVLFGPQAPKEGLSPIVETPLGLEVFWIHERRSPGIRGFDEVERPLRRRVLQARMQERRRQLLKELREQATISIHLDEDAAQRDHSR